MIFKSQGTSKANEQYSYWKYAYGIAGIEDYKKTTDDYRFKRIDIVWNDISKIADSSTAILKFSNLSKLAHCVLVIPHGNAEPERGFSINKHVLNIHGNSLKEDTIVALRLVKDCLIRAGGVEKFVVTKELISLAANRSRSMMIILEKIKKSLCWKH